MSASSEGSGRVKREGSILVSWKFGMGSHVAPVEGSNIPVGA